MKATQDKIKTVDSLIYYNHNKDDCGMFSFTWDDHTSQLGVKQQKLTPLPFNSVKFLD